MYVSSSAVIPGISTGPINPGRAAAYNGRKRRVFLAVGSAISRYNCAPVAASFDDFGVNFQNQVRRGLALLNQVGTAITSAYPAGPQAALVGVGVPAVAAAQKSITGAGDSSGPVVVPMAQVDTNPSPPLSSPPAQWDAPHWGNAATSAGIIPTPQTAAAKYPWVSVGVMAALALAAGILDGGRRGGRA